MDCGTTGWENLEGSRGCDSLGLGFGGGESIWEHSDLKEVWDRRR